MNAEVVLAHGGWADGSSWNKVSVCRRARPGPGRDGGRCYYWAKHHALAPQLGPDRHGLLWLPEEAFAAAFAQHASPVEQALLAATQRPLAAASIGVPVGRPLWKDRPSWFLVAEEGSHD